MRSYPVYGIDFLKKSSLQIHIDGAARGNPGPAGAGIHIADGSGRKIRELAVFLGEATNNVAETCALILALQTVLQMGYSRARVLTDSELLARQVSGLYRVKDQRLQWLHALIRNLQQGFESLEVESIPREKNRKADRLANQAVTEALRKKPVRRRKSSVVSPEVLEKQPSLF